MRLVILGAALMVGACATSPESSDSKIVVAGATHWYADYGDDLDHPGAPHVRTGERVITTTLGNGDVNLVIPRHGGAIRLQPNGTTYLNPADNDCGLHPDAAGQQADRFRSRGPLEHPPGRPEEHTTYAMFFFDSADDRRELCLIFEGGEHHLGQAHTHEDG